MIPHDTHLHIGSLLFEGIDLAAFPEARLRSLRGARIGMVFQDARAALNPVFTVGRQLADVFRLHHGGSGGAAMAVAFTPATLNVDWQRGHCTLG